MGVGSCMSYNIKSSTFLCRPSAALVGFPTARGTLYGALVDELRMTANNGLIVV
jgi:hypothetical protein